MWIGRKAITREGRITQALGTFAFFGFAVPWILVDESSPLAWLLGGMALAVLAAWLVVIEIKTDDQF